MPAVFRSNRRPVPEPEMPVNVDRCGLDGLPEFIFELALSVSLVTALAMLVQAVTP